MAPGGHGPEARAAVALAVAAQLATAGHRPEAWAAGGQLGMPGLLQEPHRGLPEPPEARDRPGLAGQGHPEAHRYRTLPYPVLAGGH